MPRETAAVSAQVLCTPYNHAPCHFKESHIRKVYACLAVTCHMHFWQNDGDLLRAIAVTRGWNRYRNNSAQKVDPREENSPAAPLGYKPMMFPQLGYKTMMFPQLRHSPGTSISSPFTIIQYDLKVTAWNLSRMVKESCQADVYLSKQHFILQRNPESWQQASRPFPLSDKCWRFQATSTSTSTSTEQLSSPWQHFLLLHCNYLYSNLTYWVLLCLSSGTDL